MTFQVESICNFRSNGSNDLRFGQLIGTYKSDKSLHLGRITVANILRLLASTRMATRGSSKEVTGQLRRVDDGVWSIRCSLH